MKLAGVVVFYNPTKKIISNINSYIKYLDRLYIVDNSEKDNYKLINKLPNNVVYIANKQNLGIAKALNIGAQEAIKEGYEWLLTMDQDSRYNSNELEKMIDFIANNDTKDVGLISPWHIINTGVERPSVKVEKKIEVMTSGNIVSLNAYKAVGGWKDWLFIDSVDIEFCMNLNTHNFEVLRLNYVELEHNLGDIEIKQFLTRKFVCSNHNYIRRYYMVRNMLYVSKMYRDSFPEYCRFLRRGMWGSLKNIVFWEKDKLRKIRNMYRGYKDYTKGIKGKYNYED